MHRRVLAAALSGLLLFATPAPAHAAATTGVITGVVLDAGHPVPGVQVGFPQPPRDGWVFPPVLTDANGRFRLADVLPGSHQVRFLTPGGGMDLYTESFELKAGQVKWITQRLAAHGAIAGRILTNHGAPAAGAVVGIDAGRRTIRTATDADGYYKIDFLTEQAEGVTTHVYVAKQEFGAPTQWWPRQKVAGDSKAVTIKNGRVLRVDERLLPLGSLTGTFTGPDGPIWATVGSTWSSVNNDPADGSFTLYVWPGDHRLFYRGIYLNREQWATNAASEAAATVFHVAEDQVIRHDERLTAEGTITGRLLDYTGEPLAEPATVTLLTAPNSEKASTTTDAAGNWSITLPPGGYEIRYRAGDRKQASGEVTPRSGNETYQVLPEQTTTVKDERMLQPGAVAITATLDGAPTKQFCAYIGEGSGYVGESHPNTCTEDGTVTFPAVTPGTEFTVVVTTPVSGYNYFGYVTAVAGQTTTAEIATTTPDL